MIFFSSRFLKYLHKQFVFNFSNIEQACAWPSETSFIWQYINSLPIGACSSSEEVDVFVSLHCCCLKFCFSNFGQELLMYFCFCLPLSPVTAAAAAAVGFYFPLKTWLNRWKDMIKKNSHLTHSVTLAPECAFLPKNRLPEPVTIYSLKVTLSWLSQLVKRMELLRLLKKRFKNLYCISNRICIFHTKSWICIWTHFFLTYNFNLQLLVLACKNPDAKPKQNKCYFLVATK